MITIDLLPWREERRKRLKADFIRALILAAILASLVVGTVFWYYETSITNQQARNNHVRQGIQTLDRKRAEITSLQSERQDLIARMQVIQQLQGDRPVIVHIFDEMARVTPDNVYYQSVTNNNGLISISGLADTPGAVSQLMRNYDNSAWFSSPNLQSVNTEVVAGMERRRFQMRVTQTRPAEDE